MCTLQQVSVLTYVQTCAQTYVPIESVQGAADPRSGVARGGLIHANQACARHVQVLQQVDPQEGGRPSQIHQDPRCKGPQDSAPNEVLIFRRGRFLDQMNVSLVHQPRRKRDYFF